MAPAATSPVQPRVDDEYVSVPLVAVALALALYTLSSSTALSGSLNVAPDQVLVPVFVTVTVYCTTDPGAAEATFAVLAMISGPLAMTRVTALLAVLL